MWPSLYRRAVSTAITQSCIQSGSSLNNTHRAAPLTFTLVRGTGTVYLSPTGLLDRFSQPSKYWRQMIRTYIHFMCINSGSILWEGTERSAINRQRNPWSSFSTHFRHVPAVGKYQIHHLERHKSFRKKGKLNLWQRETSSRKSLGEFPKKKTGMNCAF